ncbi:MAG TPA: VOC family protein [Actinomycetota bacterium]|nr:VOC family protein [Actinomycetota bacterium]
MAARLVGNNHVAITVSDLDRSSAWYCDLFGLTVVSNDENVGPPYFTDVRYRGLFDLTTFSYVVALCEHRDGERVSFDPRRPGLDHVGFHVPERSDLDGWVERLDERGIPHSGIKEAPYADVISFRDPDDIALELAYVKVDFWADLIGRAS